jgi:hypothetical protein
MAEHLPSTHKALGLIPSTKHTYTKYKILLKSISYDFKQRTYNIV